MSHYVPPEQSSAPTAPAERFCVGLIWALIALDAILLAILWIWGG